MFVYKHSQYGYLNICSFLLQICVQCCIDVVDVVEINSIQLKKNTYAYSIMPTVNPSDARNEIFDRESSPTLRKLNCSAFLLI